MSETSALRAAADPLRLWRRLALVLVCALTVWCYAPALHAYFVQDDFTLIALARLLREPWLVFTHDHFPGSSFFRPLGVFVWWLTTAAFDNAPRGHYLVNLLLHLGVVLALYTLLQRLRKAPANALWAAAYAVHPLAIGTALWLSDRFDLIATGFSLLAIAAAAAYTRKPRAATLAAILACLLIAFMGKEIAIVAVVAAGALIALPNGAPALSARQRWRAVAAIALLGIGWLAWRHALLTNPQTPLLQGDTLVSAFVRGSWLWLRVGIEYLTVDPRAAPWTRVLLAVGAVLLAAALVLRARAGAWRAPAYGIAAALAILILLPGPTQAPVVILSVHDVTPDKFWFDMVGESRLYHLSLAGLVAALMLLTTPLAVSSSMSTAGTATTRSPVRAQPATVLAQIGLGVMLVAWIAASHALAHDFARRTREQIAPLAAAHAAIAQLELPARRCQIYLLDTTAIWGMDGLGDPILKASSPDPQRLAHCLILTERAPWANFVRSGSLDAEDYRPLRPLTFRGAPIPWIFVGGFEAAYLDLDADIDARSLDSALFLQYRDGRFDNVTAAVHSGTRPVHFFNARPQHN